MKICKSMELLKGKYKVYAEGILSKIDNPGNDIKLKVRHGLVMSDMVKDTTINSGLFNESYVESGAVDGLLHDIGRFKQYQLSGTLKDYEAKELTGYADHGQYGKHLLLKDNKELLRYFLPENADYDGILTEVIGEHTTISNPNYILPIESLTNLFQNYDLKEVLKSSNEDIKQKLIALKLLILREEDSLEILHQISEGLWKPALGSEEKYHIKDIPWETFMDFGYINMAELKQKELWTCNTGFLLRYSLLFRNINFVGTLKAIINASIVDRVFQMQMGNITDDANNFVTDPTLRDPRFDLAHEYTNMAIKNLIKTSPDGLIITPESREKAKEKTIETFNSLYY